MDESAPIIESLGFKNRYKRCLRRPGPIGGLASVVYIWGSSRGLGGGGGEFWLLRVFLKPRASRLRK